MCVLRHLFRHRTFRLFAHVTLWFCVFLACWRAPVPWLHRHLEAGQTSEQFVAHLQTYHAGDSDDVVPGEWHVHLVLLNDILNDCSCPGFPDRDDQHDESQFVVTGSVAVRGVHNALRGTSPPFLLHCVEPTSETRDHLHDPHVHATGPPQFSSRSQRMAHFNVYRC